MTSAVAQQLLKTAVRGNALSARIHQQAAHALQRAIDRQQVAQAELPDLVALYRAAVEQAASQPVSHAFVFKHQGLRFRVHVNAKGLVEVRTWAGLPLTLGLP